VNVTLRPLHRVSRKLEGPVAGLNAFDHAAKRTPNFLAPSRVTLLTRAFVLGVVPSAAHTELSEPSEMVLQFDSIG
jgi:hypothetical protein